VAALEREKADLQRQLAAERREANEAIAKEQAAQAEAKLARAEGNLAKELAEHLQERLTALESRAKGAEAAMRRLNGRARSSWIHIVSWVRGPVTSRCRTESPGFVVCNGCRRSCRNSPLSWGGFMSYASLVTCEGAMNALSREGCRHFEVFDQEDEDFERDVYKVEDPVVKESAGALYDRMWGPHGWEVVRERAETARAQVRLLFVWRLLYVGCACVC
jgi:hypothetical protein